MVAEITIQPLTTADNSLLWEILYHAIFVPKGSERPSPSIVHEPNLAKYVHEWGRTGDMGFKAVTTHGRAIGATWLRLLTGDQPGYGYISDTIPELTIALLPGYRGQSIGTKLLERLLSAAREPFDAVSLSVSADNPAMQLYQRLGFQTVVLEGTSYTMKLDLK